MKVQLEDLRPPLRCGCRVGLLRDIEGVGWLHARREDHRAHRGTALQGTVAVRFGQPTCRSAARSRSAPSIRRRTLRLVGKGTDTTGSSGASLDLTARVDAVDAASCRLVGNSEVSMSGKAATFGGRMMSSVADQILSSFVANFITQVQARKPPRGRAAALHGQGPGCRCRPVPHRRPAPPRQPRC